MMDTNLIEDDLDNIIKRIDNLKKYILDSFDPQTRLINRELDTRIRCIEYSLEVSAGQLEMVRMYLHAG